MTRRRRRHLPGAPKRVAIYARSTKLRPLGETGALEEQVDQSATNYLEHGYLVPHDQRLAAPQPGSADSDRLALARLGEAVRQGHGAIVVVSSLDRRARDPTQSAILGDEFKAARVTIATVGA